MAKVYDEGQVFLRGQRTAVCERSYRLLTRDVYADQFIGIDSTQEKPPHTPCCC